MNETEIQDPETRVFRGSSLEELLPRIREELGPDAVVTRQREGVVGGFGGFFGKRCVEVEARPGTTLERPAVPSRTVLNAYDTGDDVDGPVAEIVEEPAEAPIPQPATTESMEDNPLLRTLMAQTTPFSDHLEYALGRERSAWLPEPIVPASAAPSTNGHENAVMDAPAVVAALLASGLSQSLAEEIVEEAETELLPFQLEQPLDELARRILARRIQVRHGSNGKRRTIALVGAPGSGRTLAAAKLCYAYARTGSRVAALSLEPARAALALAELTGGITGVKLEIADEPPIIELVRNRLRDFDLIVADTPAVDPSDPDAAARVGALLAALQPSELHLVVPADGPVDTSRSVALALASERKLQRIVASRVDAPGAGGVPVGLALANDLPISYVTDSPLGTAGIHPAEPGELARLVLPDASA
jgi:flagellar biosynthesis GTPase FlhF